MCFEFPFCAFRHLGAPTLPQDESLPFWVRKLTYSDVSGMAASQAATSPAARAYRFFISTYQYWDWIETVRDEW